MEDAVWHKERERLRDHSEKQISCGQISLRHWGSERRGMRELYCLSCRGRDKDAGVASQADCLEEIL